MRRNRISTLTTGADCLRLPSGSSFLRLFSGSFLRSFWKLSTISILTLCAINVCNIIICGSSVLATDTPAPQLTLYKDASPASTPELKPYGNEAEKRSYVEFKYHITGSNTGSYGVYLSTPSSTLTGSKNDNEDTIDSLGESVTKTLAELPANTWGWRYGTGSTPETALTNVNKEDNYFKAVRPVSTGTIVDKTNADTLGSNNGNQDTIEEHYVIQIGAAIGDITPDTYSGEIMVSAVATPKVLTKNFFEITTLQEMNADVCATVPTPTASASVNAASVSKDTIKTAVANGTSGSGATATTTTVPQTYLQDTRKTNGNKNYSYVVRKLADGNCWMVQNLYLTNGTALSNTDTHLTTKTSYTIPSPSRTSGFESKVEYMNNGSRSSTSAGSDASNNTGSYFSWKTATAASAVNIDSLGSAPDDICPKNWKLPTGGWAATSTNQFQALYDKYGNKANFDKAWYVGTLYFPGLYTADGASSAGDGSDIGSTGFWWSSTTSGSDTTNTFYLSDGFYSVHPDSNSTSGLGFSVRCVVE